MTAVNAGAVRNQLALQNKAAIATSDQSKCFYLGGEQDDRFLYRGRRKCARRVVLLWFGGLGAFSCGRFPQYELGTISNPKIISLFILTTCFSVCLKTYIQILKRRPQKKSRQNKGITWWTGTLNAHRPSTHLGRVAHSARKQIGSQLDGQHFQVAFESRIWFTY